MPATPVCGAAVVGDCGNETWAGRCVGNLLIYCNNQDPANQYVNPLQCDLNNSGRVCGSDAQGGYDCVVAQDNCQGVPSEGQCAGNVARYCDNGVLKEVDCGSVSCQQFEYQGSTLNYCYPCPANAHLNDAQDACLCNAGFVVEADQCVADGTAPTCDGGMGDGGECLENTDCSCSAPPKGGLPAGLVFLLLPTLLMLRRRGRRS